jgi:hypothetical protein
MCSNSISPCTLSKQLHFFPLANGQIYTTLSSLFVTDSGLGNKKLYWDKIFLNEKISIMSAKIHLTMSSPTGRPLAFLSSPYLVMSGNPKRMLHTDTSGEISDSLFYLWYWVWPWTSVASMRGESFSTGWKRLVKGRGSSYCHLLDSYLFWSHHNWHGHWMVILW